MARSKRSIALFEVIQTDKRFQRPGRTNSPGPIKPLGAPAAASAVASAAAVQPPNKAPVSLRIQLPQPVRIKPAGPDWKTRFLIGYRAARVRMIRQSRWLVQKRDELAPHIEPYSNVVTGVLAALALIGIVLIARQRPHAPAMALASNRILTDSVHPSVLQVAAPATPDATVQNIQPTDVKTTPARIEDSADLLTDAAAAQPAKSIISPTRQINLNYVLVQSYGDERTATEAANFLNKNNLPCTVERGVKNWRRDLYLVIGLQGFPRASGPEYVAYRNRLDDLSAQFAPSRHSYRRFDPQAIKWDRAN